MRMLLNCIILCIFWRLLRCFIMGSEPKTGTDDGSREHRVYMSTSMLTTLSSGGQDTITCTRLYENVADTTYVRPMLVVAANDIPPLSEANDAVRKRLVPITYTYSFVDQPDPAKKQKQRDAGLADVLKQPRMLGALLAVFLDEYSSWVAEGRPMSVTLAADAEEARGDIAPSMDILDALRHDFVVTKDCRCSGFQPRDAKDRPAHTDCRHKVPFKAIEESLKRHGWSHGANRTARELTRHLRSWSQCTLWCTDAREKVKGRCGLRPLTNEERLPREDATQRAPCPTTDAGAGIGSAEVQPDHA